MSKKSGLSSYQQSPEFWDDFDRSHRLLMDYEETLESHGDLLFEIRDAIDRAQEVYDGGNTAVFGDEPALDAYRFELLEAFLDYEDVDNTYLVAIEISDPRRRTEALALRYALSPSTRVFTEAVDICINETLHEQGTETTQEALQELKEVAVGPQEVHLVNHELAFVRKLQKKA